MNEVYYNFVPIQSRLFEYSEKPNEAYIADGTATLYKIKNYSSGKFVLTDTLISYIDYRTKINSLNDRNGNLYIGTSEGLSIYNLKSKYKYDTCQQQHLFLKLFSFSWLDYIVSSSRLRLNCIVTSSVNFSLLFLTRKKCFTILSHRFSQR